MSLNEAGASSSSAAVFWLPCAAVLGVSGLLLFPLAAVASSVLGLTMLAIARSDAQRYIIPDILSLPAIPLGLLAAALLAPTGAANSAILNHVLAAVVAAGAYAGLRGIFGAWKKRECMGLGDVKLAAAAGAWCGLGGFVNATLLACLASLAVLLIAAAFGTPGSKESKIPFGLFLAPAIWIIWVLQQMQAA